MRALARGTPPQPGVARPRAPVSGRTHLWQPLGPDTVVGGQAIGATRIAGRINMLAVHPDGERIYAASANGGVWYSGNGGLSWRSLGGLASTPAPGNVNRPAQRHACGAIAVAWGATEAADVVYVGTGETTHPRSAQPGHSLGGIGILRLGPPAPVAEPDPWVREAPHLLGEGVCRIALQPGGSGVVAATTAGLFERPAGAGADTAWTRVAGVPFATLQDKCADVLWTRGDGPRPERLWVWVQGGDQTGLWVRAAGQTDFTRVIAPPQALPRRAVLAAAAPEPPVSPDQIYVFSDDGGNGAPRLFRVACATAATPTATLVNGVPDVLGKQGFYDIALAVHPTQKDHVVVGGSTFPAVTPSGNALLTTAGTKDAAIVVADVAVNGAGVLSFGQPAVAAAAPKMIGAGVHADVHDLVYAKAGARLWTGCDGGVYRSDRPDQLVGFAAMNDGLGVIEANYVACHPVCEGRVAVGLQDNGVISLRSAAVWNHDGDGDGGGIAFDPLDTTRYLRQFYRGSWGSSDGTFSLKLSAAENTADHCAFYSTPAAVKKNRPAAPAGQQDVTQVIIGSSRLWYSEDFGSTWVTLPGAAAPPAGNLGHDGFGQKITVCRWQGTEVAWVLGEGQAQALRAHGRQRHRGWPGGLDRRGDRREGRQGEEGHHQHRRPDPRRRGVDRHRRQPGRRRRTVHGTRGALYLGTIGKADDAAVDTLWWFDGTNRWHATGLRRDGVPAPVTSIVCDPAFPDRGLRRHHHRRVEGRALASGRRGTDLVVEGERWPRRRAAAERPARGRGGRPGDLQPRRPAPAARRHRRTRRVGAAPGCAGPRRPDLPARPRRRPAPHPARRGRAARRPHAALVARQPRPAAAACAAGHRAHRRRCPGRPAAPASMPSRCGASRAHCARARRTCACAPPAAGTAGSTRCCAASGRRRWPRPRCGSTRPSGSASCKARRPRPSHGAHRGRRMPTCSISAPASTKACANVAPASCRPPRTRSTSSCSIAASRRRTAPACASRC